MYQTQVIFHMGASISYCINKKNSSLLMQQDSLYLRNCMFSNSIHPNAFHSYTMCLIHTMIPFSCNVPKISLRFLHSMHMCHSAFQILLFISIPEVSSRCEVKLRFTYPLVPLLYLCGHPVLHDEGAGIFTIFN